MRLIPVDTRTLTFIHLGEVQPANTQEGNQRTNAEGVHLWKVPVVVVVTGEPTPDTALVTVPSPKAPEVSQASTVLFQGLRARHWKMNNNSGVSLSADSIEPARSAKA